MESVALPRGPTEQSLAVFEFKGANRMAIEASSTDPQNSTVAEDAMAIERKDGLHVLGWSLHGIGKFGVRGGWPPIFARPEKCQSGRMGLTRNQVCPSRVPGFESLLLRHSLLCSGFFIFHFKIVYQVHISLIVNMLCEQMVRIRRRLDPWDLLCP